jgi:hypothetical protein
MRVIVCGGRDCHEADVFNWLEQYAAAELGERITMVIHGGASGADTGGLKWAVSEDGCSSRCFEANWRKHGKAAGPIRNQQMIDEGRPDAVIAFPGGRGTADMVRRAEAAGLRIVRATLPAHGLKAAHDGLGSMQERK